MGNKEYIERVALLKTPPFTKYGGMSSEYAEGYLDCADDARKAVKEAPDADVVSRGVFEQVKWERDMAMQQLEEHGIPFGGEADDVVNVVRCKDCKYFKHFNGCGNWCHRRIRTDIEFHTKTNDFCSWGKRKDKDDGR